MRLALQTAVIVILILYAVYWFARLLGGKAAPQITDSATDTSKQPAAEDNDGATYIKILAVSSVVAIALLIFFQSQG
ncbi:MAG TPA: hypothetical protein DER02_03340 [Gammaproteobacteria bacterium]|nr:hypothetical protein [Gammaproteobacteria bacterium]|tara:strand:- start:2410 stop:2640 length:231 start_codon:yes stop_codon:yes gene_type:complete